MKIGKYILIPAYVRSNQKAALARLADDSRAVLTAVRNQKTKGRK